MSFTFDALVLAGGTSRRLGTDKTRLSVDGRSVLDHVLAAVADAHRVVVVGDPRAVRGDVTWVREEPVGAGPAAGCVAGLASISAPLVVIVAGDLPGVSAETVARLLAAAGGHEGAMLVDDTGRGQYLTTVLDTAAFRTACAGRDWTDRSMRELLAGLTLAAVPATAGETDDLDTAADAARWAGEPAGRVLEIWRYPVKSLQGEQLRTARFERRGLRHDRQWALVDADGKLGSGKSTRRFRAMPGLLELSATIDGGVPVVTFPQGTVIRGDDPHIHDALSTYVRRPVQLRAEDDVSHLDEAPVHLLTTGALDWLGTQHGSAPDVRRFRPNLLIDLPAPLGGDDWVGKRLVVGDVVLAATHHPERCVMVTQSQGSIGTDPALLRTVARVHGLTFGVDADVVGEGTVTVGDPVYVLSVEEELQ